MTRNEADQSAGLRVSEITKTFVLGPQTVEVLRGVTFDLGADGNLALTGPSGSGKSTLLHIIGTLDSASSGEVEISGQSTTELKETELAHFRNKMVGFVFQDSHLLPQYSVLENVLIPALAFGRASTEDDHWARSLIDRVGLSDRLHHRPAELSGGERQRVAVARALMNKPRLLLCDEPTGSLDSATAESIATLLFDLHDQESNMLLVVTHSIDLASRFQRRMDLQEGRCLEL
jgi:lipoprotein-releasing system ATP-binding protein